MYYITTCMWKGQLYSSAHLKLQSSVDARRQQSWYIFTQKLSSVDLARVDHKLLKI